MSLGFADVAIAWLTDRHRLEERWVATSPGKTGGSSLGEHLAAVLLKSQKQARIDDVRYFASDFLSLNPDLPDWWHAALEGSGTEIRFEDREPVVAVQSFDEWKRLSDQLDPDALIALAYARRYNRPPQRRSLERWGVVPVVADRWVRRTLGYEKNKIYDLHTHLEACESALFVWHEIMTGGLKKQNLPEYSRKRSKYLAGTLEGEELEAEIRLIFKEARAAFKELVLKMGTGGEGGTGAQSLAAPSQVAEKLWLERSILIRCWQQALSRHQTADPTGGKQGEPGGQAAVHWLSNLRNLDVYLCAKSMFLRRMTMARGDNPGLANFRRFYDRMKLNRRTASRRLKWERTFRLISTAIESPRLDGIEFRIAPFDHRSEYERYFRYWKEKHAAELAGQRAKSHALPQIAFVIHFIRQRTKNERVQDIYVPALRDIPKIEQRDAQFILDRQSAALHRFRWDCPDLARHIVGIDVANIERLNPVSTYAPYLRNLRGESLEALVGVPKTPDRIDEHFAFDHSPTMRHWRRLRDEGRMGPNHDLPRLGLTYHAGEDFYHPVEGVRSIWEYVSRCGAGEGDRIGHGLALGEDLQRFARLNARAGTVPRGEALDTLVWLHRRLSALSGCETRTLREIEDQIEILSHDIYSRALGSNRVNQADLYRVQQLRHYPYLKAIASSHRPVAAGRARGQFTRTSEEAAVLHNLDNVDDDVRQQRMIMIPIPRLYFDPNVINEIDRVVNDVLKIVSSRKITIEINPTSNLCLGNIDRYSNHQIFNVIRRNSDIKFVICCDDPGTFRTRVENEYFAMLDAVRELPEGDRDEMKRAVEAAVETAQSVCFDGAW